MLWSLSSVPIERQKIMCAGKTLKDDEWNIPLKNVRNAYFALSCCLQMFFVSFQGAILLLLGTSEAIVEAPTEKVKFIEDMSENEIAQAIELPPGLVNLGNTCYLNAVVQCMRSVPELRESLKKFQQDAGFAAPQSITIAMKVGK